MHVRVPDERDDRVPGCEALVSEMMYCNVSGMIITRNRLESLQRTCRALERLDPRPKQILVTVNSYSDETVPFLRRYYPDFYVIVNDTGRGSVASRGAMMPAADSDLVLSLGDDSYPEQMDCLTKLTDLFESVSSPRGHDFPATDRRVSRDAHAVGIPNGAAQRIFREPRRGASTIHLSRAVWVRVAFLPHARGAGLCAPMCRCRVSSAVHACHHYPSPLLRPSAQ